MAGCGKVANEQEKGKSSEEDKIKQTYGDLAAASGRIAKQLAAFNIKSAASIEWSQPIAPNELLLAQKYCKKLNEEFPAECLLIERNIKIIVDAVASCDGNKTTLCKNVLAIPGLSELGTGVAVALPTNPFYEEIGNKFLDQHALEYGFREEAFQIMIDKYLIKIIVALPVTLVVILFFTFRKRISKEQRVKIRATKKSEADKKAKDEEEERMKAKAEEVARGESDW